MGFVGDNLYKRESELKRIHENYLKTTTMLKIPSLGNYVIS